MPHSRPNDLRRNYQIRVLGSLAASLLLLIALVRLWPIMEDASDDRVYVTQEREVIQMEEVRPTSHSAPQAPPPPAPLPPIEVPDDELIEQEIDLSDHALTVDAPGIDLTDLEMPPAEGEPTSGGEVVEVGPKLVRFVEPEYTREARKKKVRAELVVEVLIDERGRVLDAEITERFLLGKDRADKTPVPQVGFGLEEAARAAAERSMFRPARRNGQAVRSYSTLSFAFGV